MKKPLYKDITEKITAYIKSEKLQPGDKLPSYRELAVLFNVSTNTIGSALERLQYKGVIDIRPQSGIFVQEEAWNTLNPGSFNWQTYLQRSKDIKFSSLKRFSDSRRKYSPSKYVMSNVGLLPEFGWYDMWRRAVQKSLESLSPDTLFMPKTEYLTKINEALVKHMKCYGLNVPPDNILLTKGTYHSIQYVMQTFFAPGTVCYYVSPSNIDVISIFLDISSFIREPVPVDNEGIDLEYLSAKISKAGNAFLIVMPELSFTGVTMSVKRRKELYQLCVANDMPIIELDDYRDFRSESLPPIKAFDKQGIVFYIGSFFNTVNNSTDVGWVAANPELIERLTYALTTRWISTEMLLQETVYEMLTSGDYQRYTKHVQALMREREHKFNSLLDKYIGDIASWNRKSEVFFWIKFKNHIDVTKMADNTEGLVISEGSYHSFAPDNSVFTCLMSIRDDEMEDAVRLLDLVARNSLKF